MNNFITMPSPNYVEQLLRCVPHFAISSEYQSLDEDDRLLAGLIFSAFGRFMESSISNSQIVDECAKAIERFAASEDIEAHNLLVTEVFEGFRRPDVTIKFLAKESRALYDKWIG